MKSTHKKWVALSLAAAFIGTSLIGSFRDERAVAAAPTGSPAAPVQLAAAAAAPQPGGAAPAAVQATVQPTVAQAGPKPFEVFPSAMVMQFSRDRQAIVGRITQPDGITRDVTNELKFTVVDPKVAVINGNVVAPVGDGKTEIRVQQGANSAVIPVEVKDGTIDRPISFKLDVMPVFLRSGCNVGGCHGAARGKDGFRLSLFGFDPEGDYHRVTREMSTRRINLAIPRESLLLTKATGAVAHTGGKLFDDKSDYYNTILRWLEAGAPKDVDTVAKPVSMEVLPQRIVLEGEGAKQPLIARATYSDGSVRDVTNLAVFLTSNDNSATITPAGMVTAKNRGEAFVMARFNTFTVGTQVIVIPKNLKYVFPKLPEYNYIDTLVDNKLKKLRVEPSPICSDEVFLRRASIDIVGQLPNKEVHAAFMASTDPKKREKLVDELLGRKEFVDMWVMKWAELLQIRSSNDTQVSYKAALRYFEWLEDKISRNVPFDQVVQQLLTANGGTFKNPATNYFQVEKDPLKLAENTAEIFMGMRVQCAQCHNHPFDRWTQDDYYGFASFFSQVARKTSEDPRELIISNSGGGEVNHPVPGRKVVPKFLGGEVVDTKGVDRREVLAKWLASPQNPYFAKNLANIVWSHFNGRGIIEPVDDVRISNPASNPELLEALGQKFTEYNYDFKKLVRDICLSRTYQTATETNESNVGDERNFAHASVRRMRAEVLLDCINEVTETKEKFKGLPLGSRAVQIADGTTSNYFLVTFGRATRETACSCEVSMQPNLSQALSLINGETIQGKIVNGGVVRKLFADKKPPSEVISELYLRCLSRPASVREQEKLGGLLANAKTPDEQQKAMEDVFWALLNAQEFMFNH